nr:short chain dehydrogenase andi [Quercus suber]
MIEGFDLNDPDTYTKPFNVTPTYHRDPYPFISPESSRNSQEGRIILVVGAGDGIGAAAAKVWARSGAEGIALVARRKETLDQVEIEIKTITSKCKVLVVPADITNGDDVRAVFSKIRYTYGRSADVVLQVAGLSAENETIGETDPDEWWKSYNVNLKGSYSVIHHFINTQVDPKAPTGTVIIVSGNRAGLTERGQSAYNISKLAQQRLVEHVHLGELEYSLRSFLGSHSVLEYPTLRSFTASPGIVLTKQITPDFTKYATDHPDLLGSLTLYLAQPRADFLRGDYVSVNWDLEELESYRDEIVSKRLLKTSWLPIMPIGGGLGFGGSLAQMRSRNY